MNWFILAVVAYLVLVAGCIRVGTRTTGDYTMMFCLGAPWVGGMLLFFYSIYWSSTY